MKLLDRLLFTLVVGFHCRRYVFRPLCINTYLIMHALVNALALI